MDKRKRFWAGQEFWLKFVVSVTLLLSFGDVCLGTESEGVQHYKMLSTVEYAGNTQFRNQVEMLFTVRKEFLSDDKVKYSISTNDFELIGSEMEPGERLSSNELLFVIDGKTRGLTGCGGDLALLEKVNNQCVRSLKKVTRENIGKTWKQSFKLSFLDHLLTDELKFTLTAIQLKTKVFGEMIAVRALSEPFSVKAVKEEGGVGDVKCRMNAVYVFDSGIEDIYLSISVFEATTKINGSKETLRYEIATYKADSSGAAVDLSGLGKEFEKFVRKVGLTGKAIKVNKESSLPQWAHYEGLAAAQVTNLCAATACEGALNPVASVCLPAARTIALQSGGKLAMATQLGAISGLLVKSIPGASGMQVAVAPAAFMGVGLGTAGAIAGGTAGTIAIAGGGGGDDGGTRSPSS